MLLEEQQIEHYRILRSLGSGKMYLAKDTHLDKQVAIRVMEAETLVDAQGKSAQELRQSVLAEIDKIAHLDHPFILLIHHYGMEIVDETAFAYIVTQFCNDGSLIDWLQQRPEGGLLAPQAAARLISQIASPLHYAHTQDIIHRRLAPSKLLIRRVQGNRDVPGLWLTGFEPVGTEKVAQGDPLYMAPEQWDGDAVPATDQYALAVIAYRLVTGELPFRGGRERVKDQHLHHQPTLPSQRVAGLPPLLDGVLLKALAKQPEERFVSVNAFAAAFSEAAQSKGAFYSTLVLSKAEAQGSVSRMIALPGERRINLAIPAGTYDGQIIRLRGQGAATNEPGAGTDLFVVISIDETRPDPEAEVIDEMQSDPEATMIVERGTDDSTIVPKSIGERGRIVTLSESIDSEPTFREFGPSRHASPVTPIPPASQVTPVPPAPLTPIPPPPPAASLTPPPPPPLESRAPASTPILPMPPLQGRVTTPIPRVELLGDEPTLKPVSSAGGGNTYTPPPPAPPPPVIPVRPQVPASWQPVVGWARNVQDVLAPSIREVAQTPVVRRARNWYSSQPGITNILLLVLAFLVIIGGGSLLYTGSVNQQVTNAVQATATAQIRTVSHSFDATVTAQTRATATAVYDPYPPVHGTLAFADPLSDNGKDHHWQEVASMCNFVNGSYQLSNTTQGVNTCTADDMLENFTYQVQMVITQGDAGGVVFRYDSTRSAYYYFSVSTKGSYTLSYWRRGDTITILGPASSSAIKMGTGQLNLLAVVARGRNIDLYVNNQRVAGITDATVAKGQIGMAVENNGTEVTFHDVKVWNI